MDQCCDDFQVIQTASGSRLLVGKDRHETATLTLKTSVGTKLALRHLDVKD